MQALQHAWYLLRLPVMTAIIYCSAYYVIMIKQTCSPKEAGTKFISLMQSLCTAVLATQQMKLSVCLCDLDFCLIGTLN